MAASLSTLHPDIIRTHILTRLDGPALMATSTASTQLRDLSTEGNLWQQICLATWGSTSHPRVRQVISTFPHGHRSFFSDSFPLFDHSQPSNPDYDHDHDRSRRVSSLISAVDMHYKNDVIFSRVHETDTVTGKFFCSPFRVELLDQRETVQTPVHHHGDIDSWIKHMEENLSLSWIVIDTSRKRAANLSTRRPVRVEWPCTAGDVQLHYTTIVAGNGQRGSRAESIECGLVVTCSGVEDGKVQVEEVSMCMKDMDGRILNGGDSLDVFQMALRNGNRKKSKIDEGKQKYREFMKRKKETREKKHRRERTLDQLHFALMVCIVFWICLVLAEWSMEQLS